MCLFKLLMALACFVATAYPAEEDVGNYTVLYDGPDGSHLQTGEPGKAVKGFYTFFDSRRRMQKVTYEADARGYRVTSAGVVPSSGHVAVIPVTTHRPRIIEKVVPKLQAGVLFNKKMNEARSEFTEHSAIQTDDEPQVTSQIEQIAVATENPSLEQVEKEIIVHIKSASKGQIKFKQPNALINYDFAYNLGYPFVAGIYVYAL